MCNLGNDSCISTELFDAGAQLELHMTVTPKFPSQAPIASYIWHVFRKQDYNDHVHLSEAWADAAECFDLAFIFGLHLRIPDPYIVLSHDVTLLAEIAALEPSAAAVPRLPDGSFTQMLTIMTTLPPAMKMLLLFLRVLVVLYPKYSSKEQVQAEPAKVISEQSNPQEVRADSHSLPVQDQSEQEQPHTAQDSPGLEANTAKGLAILRRALLVLKLATLASNIPSGQDTNRVARSALWASLEQIGGQLYEVRLERQAHHHEAGSQPHLSDTGSVAHEEQLLSGLLTRLLVQAIRHNLVTGVCVLCCGLLAQMLLEARPCAVQAVAAELLQAGMYLSELNYAPFSPSFTYSVC